MSMNVGLEVKIAEFHSFPNGYLFLSLKNFLKKKLYNNFF